MRKYELSRAADRNLDEIYIYTFREFGALQADACFESLEECLTRLGENPLLGIDASNVRRGYRRFVHQRHTLYYRKSRSGVTIIRIDPHHSQATAAISCGSRRSPPRRSTLSP